jgi:3-oxoacyl-[acyl-carrier protein] reductase
MKSINNSKKTIIISGSSIGMGANLVNYFLNQNFNVTLNYLHSKKQALLLKKNNPRSDQLLILKGDVSNYNDVVSIVKKTKQNFGKIDALINNAGIHLDSKVVNMSLPSWKKVIDTNLTGVFNFCKATLPIMKKQNYGKIINISSFTGLVGSAGASNYAASKAGILAFSKSVAKEVAKYNITVNSIAPGFFDIGMFNDFDLSTRKKLKKNIPSKRLGNPNEICELCNVLILSNYLTGQTFVLDGGFSI